MVAPTPETGPGADRAADGTPRVEDVALIERHVARSAQGRIYDLRVESDGGQLVLRGRSRTYYAKQLAQQAAIELAESATRVVNHISII